MATKKVAETVEKVESTVDSAKEKVESVKDTLVSKLSLPDLDPALVAGLTTLAKGVAVASADAALVYLNDNIATVQLGTYQPIIVSLVGVGVRNLRNLLHGGTVSMDTVLEALDVKLPEKEEKE